MRKLGLLIAVVPTLVAQAATSPCDLNGDGVVNVADVQIAINEVLGLAPCTMNLDGTGVCDVADVQRVIAAALGGPCVVTPPTSSTITLPVEVMGQSGTTSSVSFNIPSSSASLLSGTQTLSLQIHGLKYETEASVQVNNSGWIPMNSSTVKLQGPASNYGGIGGGFHTLSLTMSLPAGTVTTGNNTMTFQFNGTDGITSGYRVLALNVIGSDGVTQLVPSSSFVWDDPNNWQAPLNDANDIAAGQSLYTSASLTVPNTSGGTTAIRAHCSDCHTIDGRDLHYFNYSNNSIVVRSVFHGLTTQQGNQIASYIRSLNVPNPGRPWNPPYQPGPGTDSLPVSSWAGGAGLSAVLSSDAAMLPYVAPTQTTADFNPNGNLSLRNTPISFQLPDWNQWLPTIHPIDNWGTTFTENSAYTDYLTLRNTLVPNNPAANANQVDALNQWDQDRVNFGYSITPAAGSAAWSNPATAEGVYSVALWQMVKMWELNQEFGLESIGQTVYGPKGDVRAWLTYMPFYTSPNLLKIPEGSPGIGNGSNNSFGYHAFMWYYLQMVLNAGNTQEACNTPVDYGYLFGFMDGMAMMNSPQAMLFLASLTKGMQVSQLGQGPQVYCGSYGWLAQDSNPVVLVWPKSAGIFTGLPASTTAALVNAYVSSWLSVVQSFTPQQIWDNNAKPTDAVTSGNPFANLASAVAYMIPRLHFLGVSQETTNGLVAWAKTIWPSNGYNWSSTTAQTCTSDSSGNISCGP